MNRNLVKYAVLTDKYDMPVMLILCYEGHYNSKFRTSFAGHKAATPVIPVAGGDGYIAGLTSYIRPPK